MVLSSGCEALNDEPERFLPYLFADKRVKRNIVDMNSLEVAVRRQFSSDRGYDGLHNMIKDIDSKGKDLQDCLKGLKSELGIQSLIDNNTKKRKRVLRKRVKKQRPELKGKKLSKEVDRRLKISLSSSKNKIKKLKEPTISQAKKPIRVSGYSYDGKIVKPYRKSKRRDLTPKEREFILQRINKPRKEVIREYQESQKLEFRSEVSIRRYYDRIKREKR